MFFLKHSVQVLIDVAASSTKLTTLKTDSKQIWTEDEVLRGAEFDDIDDPRQQPQSVVNHTVGYKLARKNTRAFRVRNLQLYFAQNDRHFHRSSWDLAVNL